MKLELLVHSNLANSLTTDTTLSDSWDLTAEDTVSGHFLGFHMIGVENPIHSMGDLQDPIDGGTCLRTIRLAIFSGDIP